MKEGTSESLLLTLCTIFMWAMSFAVNVNLEHVNWKEQNFYFKPRHCFKTKFLAKYLTLMMNQVLMLLTFTVIKDVLLAKKSNLKMVRMIN